MSRTNFVEKEDLLREVHLSKTSFCEYTDKKYQDFDHIILHYDITEEDIEEAKKKRKEKTGEDVPVEELVFRVMTYEHIPKSDRKQNPKINRDKHVALNFKPFKHFIVKNGKQVEVGRSHTKNGKFSLTGGRLTDKLGEYIVRMIDRYARLHSYATYSYLDDVKAEAMLKMTIYCLKYDEYLNKSIFSYFTSIISSQFLDTLAAEKKQQAIRDDLLEEAGSAPSLTRQLDNENHKEFRYKKIIRRKKPTQKKKTKKD